MSARSAVLARREDAGPIRIQIGATTRTFTAGQYARLVALLHEGAVDLPGLSSLRRGRPLSTISTAPRPHAGRTLWDVADAVVPGLIWIAGLLFAAGALPV